MKAAIYIRVSTDEQAREGYSIDAQKRNLTKYAIEKNLEIYDYYIDDGWSAKDLNRPGLQGLFMDAQNRKFDVVCVWALDRLTRDIVDMWTLINTFKKNGIQFLSMSDSTKTDTASGRLELNVKGIFAQYERERIGERVVEGMYERAKQGYYTARRVLGYDYDRNTKMYIQNKEEAKIVRLIFELHCKGWGAVRITKHLNDLGYKTKKGGPFASNSVHYKIKNGWYYCGKFLYRAKGKEPILINAINIKDPILSEEEFLYAQTIAKANFTPAKKYGSEEFTFKRRLKCICGRTYSTLSSPSLHKTGKILLRYYNCRNAQEGRCENKGGRRNDKIEKEFGEFLKILAGQKYVVLIERNKEMVEELKEKINSAKNQREKEKNRKKRLQYFLLDKAITKDEFLSIGSEINASIEKITEEIQQLEEQAEELERLKAIEKEKELALKLADIWEDADQPKRKELIQRFVKRIVYSDHIEKVDFIL